MRHLLAIVAAVLLATSTAHARAPAAPVPGLTADQETGLKLRIVKYQGHTNGSMLVDVTNDATSARTFEAAGLYFVPQMDPEVAPQRLGAAGPIELVQGRDRQAVQRVEVAPGQTVRLELQVFCIDSHRPSPGPDTPFKLADGRLPPELRREIEVGTRKILQEQQAPSAKRAAGAVQSHVWQTRDKKWIALEGERKAEKAPPGERGRGLRELPVQRRTAF